MNDPTAGAKLPTRKEMEDENDGRQLQRADYIVSVLCWLTLTYDEFDAWRRRTLAYPDTNQGSDADGTKNVWAHGKKYVADDEFIEVLW